MAAQMLATRVGTSTHAPPRAPTRSPPSVRRTSASDQGSPLVQLAPARYAGKTWTHLGLEGTRQIGRVLVDPKDPNTIFVAALGHVYGANPDRGVYRSRD